MSDQFPFSVKHNISLKNLSTFALDGFAKNYIPISNKSDLVKVLNYLWNKKQPFKVFAGGSNIVFPDSGLDHFLIHFTNGSLNLEKNLITCDAGVSLFQVIKLSLKNSLSGLENLSGIPGSIGGAVVGNAGAYGSSVSEVIKKIEVWSKGKISWLTKEECEFSYRESLFKKKPMIILSVAMNFTKSDSRKLKKISAEIISLRKQKYKPGLKCPGSFFKNVLATEVSPKILSKINQSVIISGKIPAGYLLTEIGARGMKIGDIEVSDFHGNLLINNTGSGKSEDVKKLGNLLKQKVYSKFGIMLEEEVKYL